MGRGDFAFENDYFGDTKMESKDTLVSFLPRRTRGMRRRGTTSNTTGWYSSGPLNVSRRFERRCKLKLLEMP